MWFWLMRVLVAMFLSFKMQFSHELYAIITNGTMWFLKLYSGIKLLSDDSQIVVVAPTYHTTRKMSNQWIYSMHILWLFSENSVASHGQLSGRVPK